MDKKVLKKILLVLSILFTILTFVGAGYVLLNKGQVSAGYSAIPMESIFLTSRKPLYPRSGSSRY